MVELEPQAELFLRSLGFAAAVGLAIQEGKLVYKRELSNKLKEREQLDEKIESLKVYVGVVHGIDTYIGIRRFLANGPVDADQIERDMYGLW